jgi:hypothetical protein
MTPLSRRAFNRLALTVPTIALPWLSAVPAGQDPGDAPTAAAGYTLTERDRAEAAAFLRTYRDLAAAVATVPLDDDIPPACPCGHTVPSPPSHPAE